jgi:hypothetical protein
MLRYYHKTIVDFIAVHHGPRRSQKENNKKEAEGEKRKGMPYVP